MTCKNLKENFGLEYDKPNAFVRSQCFPDCVYLLWSAFCFLYHFVWIILEIYWEITDQTDNKSWFIFLTNWGYLVIFIYFGLDCSFSIYIHCVRKGSVTPSNSMNLYLKTVWVIFNIMNASSILITFSYFTFLDANMHARSINKHMINSVFTVLNIVITDKPVRFWHMWFPALFAVIYLIFNGVYQKVGDEDPIYPVLDWNKFGSALEFSLLELLIALPVSHTIVFVFYKLRCCCPRRPHEESPTYEHFNNPESPDKQDIHSLELAINPQGMYKTFNKM
ncbi:protein rolling stone-like [Saccostrea cucullata]|uniref:protein rolling stone-like n=1 Tax=Saccostrea cuccullata TaxID=36930 RepID=UPI002ED62907